LDAHTHLVVNVLTYMPGGDALAYTPGGEHAHVVQSTTHNIEDELLCTSDEICSLNVQ